MNTRNIVAAVALAGAVIGGSMTAANATASTNWQSRTCSAFTTWRHHKTGAHLDAMEADSFHVAWKYLGWDVDGLYGDVRGKAAAKYITNDEKYVTEDCDGD
jgi:hypothetical protein